MKVKHNMTYKKKQYRPKPKKQKTKRFNPKPKAKAKSSYRHFKKPIKHIQRGGVIPEFLPNGWSEQKDHSTGKIYYVAEGKAPTWDRPKHDQWFYGDVSFPPIPDQTIGALPIPLEANTVFDNNGVIIYTGLPVEFESSNSSVASITSNQRKTYLNINNPGTATIWAYQQGNHIFNPTNEWNLKNSTRTVNVHSAPTAYSAPPPAHFPPPAYSAPPTHFLPPPAYNPHTPHTPAHAYTPPPALPAYNPHNIVYGFNDLCDPRLDHQTMEFKRLISNIQTNPNAYNPNPDRGRGHTFLYSAFRGTGNICLITCMMAAGCDIMQPNKPMPKWMWESDDGHTYSDCDPVTQNLLETTLVSQFVTATQTTHVDVQGISDVTSNCNFNFDPRNITTSGTQVVVVQGVGTKTDIVVSRDIITGTWTWFMNDEEQFNYPLDVSRVLETAFKTNNGNGFCKFDNPPIISNPGQPTVNLIQVKFITNAVLRQTNIISHSARSVIRVCNTSYPFHGAIERLRRAAKLTDALMHSENIIALAGLVRHDNMHIIKTLRNDIFYPQGGTKHAFMAIDELLAAKNELLREFKNPPVLITRLDSLVNIFSIKGKGIDDIGKPLTPCPNTNVTVRSDDKIEIIIDSRRVEISIGSFIQFDRWVLNYNPTLTISIVKTKAIVTHFGGSFDSTDHKKSRVNRIFYLPWREDENRWTTSSYPRAIGLTSGYLNEYWDTIQVIGCPSPIPKLCTLDAIINWQNEEYKSKSTKKK